VAKQIAQSSAPDDSPKPEQRRWTVMVFMGAGPIEGDAPLEQFLNEDIAEMERVITSGGANAKVNVFYEFHGLGRPGRKWVGVDREVQSLPRSGSAVDSQPILAFIDSSLTRAHHRAGDYSVLVLWGHAYQFAIGRQRTVSGVDALDVGEFADALRQFQARMQRQYDITPERARLDIVGFDACDISTLELANQLEPFARYLIGSQIGIPLPGWPYDLILERLARPRGEWTMTPAEFGRFAVRKFCDEYSELGRDGRPRPVSLTLLDLAKAPQAFDAAELLASAIARACADDSDELEIVLEQFDSSQTIVGKPFVDVADFCLNLSRHSGSAAVRARAARLGDILIRPSFRRQSGEAGRPGSLIVEHGRNAHQTAKLHGVSLYAPHILGPGYDWRTSHFWYNKFDFTGETFWSRLVHILAEGN